jgi:Zn-dependent alcohol dehydrogenase
MIVQDLVIEDVEVSPPKAGEVRIRIVATGVLSSNSLRGFDT